MTKQQALRRVWANLRATLELDMKRDFSWVNQSPGPDYRPLCKKDRKRMEEAAKEVLEELYEKENRNV